MYLENAHTFLKPHRKIVEWLLRKIKKIGKRQCEVWRRGGFEGKNLDGKILTYRTSSSGRMFTWPHSDFLPPPLMGTMEAMHLSPASYLRSVTRFPHRSFNVIGNIVRKEKSARWDDRPKMF